MKKRLLPVALLFGTFAANAQVGIGTATPNKSAELLIESSNRGLLIPNVALLNTTDKTTITNGNVQSLMVYATKTQGDITPGYYYWDINKWVRLTADKDIPQIVVNNFQEIVNKDGDKVQNIIKNIVNSTEGNVVYEGDKFYQITKQGDKIVKQEIKDKLTSIAYDEASGDYIYYNENAVDRNGKIIGEGIRIKVKETVINKFGDIINNKTVQEHITNYLDGTSVGGNVYYEGDKLTYVTKEGDRKEVSINQVVTANESKTAIITVNKKQYYVSEEYLVANKGVVPTTVDSNKLPKGIYAIDVVGGVVNNFEEIVQQGPVTVDGRTFKTVNDYITYLTESKGGFTKIVYDQKTGDVIFQQWNETTQKFENVDNSKFNTIVKSNETITTLVDNKNGTYTYKSENGTETIVDIPSSVVKQFNTIVKQPVTVDGRTFNNVDEYIKYVTESKGGFTKIVYNKEGDVVFQEWNETTQKFENVDNSKFSTIVKDNETVTTLVKNADGTYTYYNEKQIGVDGKPIAGETGVTIDPKEVSVALNATTNKYEFKNSKGDVIGEIDANAKAISYDNSKSGIDAKNVQDALDKLADNLLKGAGVKLEDKNDGKVTLVADNGTVLGSIEKSKLTEDKANKGLFTFTRNDGTDVVFDVNKVNVEKVGDDKGNISYVFKDSKGATLTTIDSTADVVSNLTKKGDIYTEIISILKQETDSLTHLGNGKYKHISADGTVEEFDVNTVNVSETKDSAGNVLGYDFKDADGNVITTVKTAAINNFYNDSVTNLGTTTVQGAIEKLLEKVTTVEGTKGSLTSASIYVDGGANALLKDAKLDVKGGAVDGQVLVTVTKDVVVGKDANGADIVESRKVTEWQDPKAVVSDVVTASNGITVTNNATDGSSEFKLGGYLTQPTVIDTKENTLAIANMDSVEKGKVLENNLVIADTNGILKQTTAKNLIEDAVGKGDLVAKSLTSESIVVTGGNNTVLKDTQLEIKGGSKEGQVLVSTPKVDNQGKPVVDKDNNPVYVTKWVDAAGNTVKSGQGVTIKDNNTVNLGGKIINNGTTPGAVIDLTNDKGDKAGDIAIKGLDNVTTNPTGNSLVIADKDGVLKQTSAKNLIEDAVGKGDLVAKSLTSESIYVDGGANALLKDAKLDLKGGTVDGQVLVTVTKDVVVGKDANGADIVESRKVTEWQDPKAVVSDVVTASNGITVTNNAKDGSSEFKLGGYLTQPTVIDTKENTLAIANLKEVAKGEVKNNNVVMADANGVLQETSAANLIGEAITDGKIVAKHLTSKSIVVTGGDNTVLKDTKLEIKGGTSEGQVLVTTPELDKDGKPVVDKDGKPVYTTTWVNAAGNTVKSGQGITVATDNTVNLGGKIKNDGITPGAIIDLTGTDNSTKAGDIAIKGLEGLVGKDATTGTKLDTNTDNLVIADANGVLKQTSAKNLIEDAVGKGDLEAKQLKGAGITVTAGDKEGTGTSVASSLLKDVTLGIANGAVTQDKLYAGTKDADGQGTPAAEGTVPVANADGTVTYQDLQTQIQAKQKTVVLENGINTKVSSRVDTAKPNETIWKVDVANTVKTVTSATALGAEDAVLLVDASVATTDIVVTLPEADEKNRGKKYTIKKLDNNENGYVVVAGNIAGVEVGKKVETGLPYSGWDFVSDGTQWQIVNKF